MDQKVAVLSRLLSSEIRGINRFDGAIAKIVQGVSISQQVLGVGRITGVAASVQVGERVRISGRTSGLIVGAVVETGSTVSFDSTSGPVTFAGLVKLDCRVRAGDAGAPVLDKENQIVGFVLVGGDATYVMPIKPVLQALEVSLLN
jgi:hypothetical protein